MSEKIEIIAELKDLVSGKMREINGQLEQMDQKLQAINTGQAGKGGIMGQVLGANLLTVGITKAASAVISFGKESAMAYGKNEQFLTSMTTMFKGNKAQAQALDNQLKGFAIETPFELTEIRDATKMMIAYGSSAGNVVSEMRMLGDISSGVGQPLSEVAYLYGTLRTQGRAFSRDIYQFTGRGIPIIKELAKQFKVADSAVMKLVEDGKVGFRDIERAMKSMTSEGGQFNNMMAEQSKTLLGQVSNLSDAWDQLKTSIGESQSGILKNTVAWATEMVNQLNLIARRGNFFDEATKNIKPEDKVNASMWSQLGSAIFGSGNDGVNADKQYSAFNRKNKDEFKYFHSAEDRDDFIKYNKQGKDFMPGATRGTTEILGAFSDQMFDRFNSLSKAGDPALAGAKFKSDLVKERARIIDGLGDHTMSSTLATNELAVISKVMKDIDSMTALSKEKGGADAKAAEEKKKEPSKLETLAKANRATQITVNIENLIREYNNAVATASEAGKMTAEFISQVLLGAVNDIYAVGQQ